MCIEQFAEWSKVLLTPVIALIAATAAILQMCINRRKLQLDLFDKRYKIWEKTGEFLSSILVNGEVQPGADLQFLIDTKSSIFLFREEVSTFLRNVYEDAVSLQALSAEIKSLEGYERSTYTANEINIKTRLIHASKTIDVVFAKDLKLKH